MLTVTEAALRLAVSESYVCRMCQQGRIPANKRSGVWLIDVARIYPPERGRGRPRKAKAVK